MFRKDVGSANNMLMCCSLLLLKNNIFMTVKDQFDKNTSTFRGRLA